MKRFITLFALSSFATLLVQTAGAQSRPRRVGTTPPPQQQGQQKQAQQSSRQSQQQPDDTSQISRPSRPPVLGGANRDPNQERPGEQKPAATSSKDAGPEEVGEGDVVRV